MTSRRLTLVGDPQAEPLRWAFAAMRSEFRLYTTFSADVLAEADAAAEAAVQPDRDETDVAYITIDPPEGMDLDQAMCLERTSAGYRVRYAIADIAAFVAPGGGVDAEARVRGETIYLSDGRIPLHPPFVSEGAASLLPEQNRPAYVWDLALDTSGRLTATGVYRALVRSRARFDYPSAQRSLDAGTAGPELEMLAEIGGLRADAELQRGGASLPKPEQEVIADKAGYRLRFRPPVPLKDDNAQISLLTGMAAAGLMLQARVGILRTMPAPADRVLEKFRREAVVLGVPWPRDMAYGRFLRTLDRARPTHLALIHLATGLFRGAGYRSFDGAPPEDAEHAAIAAPYAHVTAPLRRLVDRFALVVCAAVSAGQEIPEWAREALPTLPDIMRERDRLAGSVDRAATDAVEAAVLSPHVGELFEVTVVDRRPDKGTVTVLLAEPAVEARAAGDAEPGSSIQVRLTGADVVGRRVDFEVVSS